MHHHCKMVTRRECPSVRKKKSLYVGGVPTIVWTMSATDAGGWVELVRLMSMLTLTRVKPSALRMTEPPQAPLSLLIPHESHEPIPSNPAHPGKKQKNT